MNNLTLEQRTDRYRQEFESREDVPIFFNSWWLDAAAGASGWAAATVERDGRIVAAMPFAIKSLGPWAYSSQPPLTQFLGPWIEPSNGKRTRQLAWEKEALSELLRQLPSFAYFCQHWHYSATNWLPFYWKGYQQTTRYTYLLEDLGDEEKLWGGLQQNVRREIRKARDRYSLSVIRTEALDEFLELNRLTFERQGMRRPVSISAIRRLDRACRLQECRTIFIARDHEGRPHAGAYIVWNRYSAYYLLGGGDPTLRSSGATSLCLWEAIRYSRQRCERFDFEGSMLEPVERYFRAFGADQKAYFRIEKWNSRLLALGAGFSRFLRFRRIPKIRG